MMTLSNFVCDTLSSSCVSGNSGCHACRVSKLATDSSTYEQRRVHWHTIPSRHENCCCAWSVSVQPFGTDGTAVALIISKLKSLVPLLTTTLSIYPLYVWLCNIWLEHATLWVCPLFCVDIKLSPSCWRKNIEWGCAEENIWTGKWDSKRRPEKFHNFALLQKYCVIKLRMKRTERVARKINKCARSFSG
jgi:hypothetical protein